MFETKLPYYREIIRFCVYVPESMRPTQTQLLYVIAILRRITLHVGSCIYIYNVNIVVYTRRAEYIIIINASKCGNTR